MTKPLITSIVGARPQFVKAAPLLHLIQKTSHFEQEIVHTGQHYDKNLSAIFFDELDIPEPKVNLGVGSGSHAQQTAEMLIRIEEQLVAARPDLLLIYGDTNSTLAGALAAVKLGIPLAHIEAGLRSYNREMPEESNRLIADHLSDLLLAPTQQSMQNLRQEGFKEAAIKLVGDLMLDAILANRKKATQSSQIIKQLALQAKAYYVATIHRQENTDNPENLGNIWEAFTQLSEQMPLIIPLHPRTSKQLQALKLTDQPVADLIVIEPLGYLDMIELIANAKCLLTDSGGLQKEAFALGLPCVTLRTETEWVELVENGLNKLQSPSSSTAILEAVAAMQSLEFDPQKYDFYGDGHAAEKMIVAIRDFLAVG